MTSLHDNLSEKICTACRGDTPALSAEELTKGLSQLPLWNVIDVDGVNQLCRVYAFKNFVLALEFTQAVGALAEEFNHHPALLTQWGKVTVAWWTHKIEGLHENDLIMAAKTEELFMKRFSLPIK